MSDLNEQLLACAHCGGTNLQIDVQGHPSDCVMCGDPECEDCGATAPSIDIWNLRAAASAPKAELTDEQITREWHEWQAKEWDTGKFDVIGFARAVLAAATPAASVLQTERDRYERMFLAACENLAAIADDLGIDSNIEGGAAPILREIAALRAAAPAVQQPAEGGWVANTGEQPVADETRVDIELGTAKIYRSEAASDWRWDFGDPPPVIRWRPAAPTQAEG